MRPLRRREPLRAILFDAGNTLLRMDYGVIAGHLASRGRAVTADEVEEAELRARVRLDRDLTPDASTESRNAQGRYLRYLLMHLGISGEDEIQDIARWRRGYNLPVGLWSVGAPQARAALARVKAAGLVTGVISNSNGSVRSALADAGLVEHLDFVIDSSEVGVEKPDPRIFRLGLERARVPPGAAVYVGDLYSVDVLGARAAGLEAVLLDPRGYWGPRDCALARDLEQAVALSLGPAPR
jgi:putative hydrolase of the HAD superfamily